MPVISPTALSAVVALASRAPSVHNSQPWQCIARDGELRLFLASHRVPRAADDTGRQAVLSCGALLDHVRVAAAAAGWQAQIARFPNPNNLDHLATVEFSPAQYVTDADRARADAILARRTDRLPFAAPQNWAAIEPLLRSAVDPEQATFTCLGDAVRPQLAQASRLTEAMRRYDSSYHAELRWWTAPFEIIDGVPHSTLPSQEQRGRVDIGREFPAGDHPDRDPALDHDRSAVLVLSTDGDSRREALGCGEALSAVLLEATLAGLATCTLSHMTELRASRDIVRALTGSPHDPQVLIRVGVVPALADQPAPTPRRPLVDVLEFRDPTGEVRDLRP